MFSFFRRIAQLFNKENKSSCYCCKDCMGTLNDVLDGEAPEKDVQYFHEHIDKCKPCFEHYHIDKSVKEVLKYKIENKEIPTSLIDSIKSKIKHEC